MVTGISSVRAFVRKWVFYIVFALNCLIGGLITYLGVPYRPFYAAIPVLLCIPFYPFKTNRILLFHIVFAFHIALSTAINGGGAYSLLTGIRLPAISYLMYLSVSGYFTLNRSKRLLKTLKVLAIMQLPIVVVQLVFYESLNPNSAVPMIYQDFRFGTFYIKGDPIMSTFLLFLIIHILFDSKKFSKLDVSVVSASVLSILIGSSRVSQFALIGVLGYYFLSKSSLKQKVASTGLVVIVALSFHLLGYTGQFVELFSKAYDQATLKEGADIDRFESGKYARGGAILYFINQPIKVIGDGPGKYTDPLKQTLDLGLNGAYFKAYAELGIIGVGLSILGIYLIAITILPKGSTRTWSIISFILIGITQDIYNHADMIFVFYLCAFAISYSHKDESSPKIKERLNPT